MTWRLTAPRHPASAGQRWLLSSAAGRRGCTSSATWQAATAHRSHRTLMNGRPTVPPPDFIWIAHWLTPAQYRPDATVWSSYLPNSLWSNHQRIRQYAGGHNETWGGVTLDTDSNVLDGAITTIPLGAAPRGKGAPLASKRWGARLSGKWVSTPKMGAGRCWASASWRQRMAARAGKRSPLLIRERRRCSARKCSTGNMAGWCNRAPLRMS